jgi:hypothetical protein
MEEYIISEGSILKGKELKLDLKVSSKKLKKIDCYCMSSGLYKFSIGDIRQLDYYQVLEKEGIMKACELRRAYRIRHRYDKTEIQFVSHRILY